MAEDQKIDLTDGLDLKLAEAYIPFQIYNQSYELATALKRGTLFPELYKPYQRNN